MLKTKQLFRSIFRVSLTVALLPAAGAIAGTLTCECGAPTTESYTWDFPAEATERLEEMEFHAEAAEDQAEKLVAYADQSAQMSWQVHVSPLVQTQQHLNDISRSLCRLKLIDRSTLAWQQQAIDQIEPLLNDAATSAEEAIDVLNENRRVLVVTNYGDHVEQVYRNARLIDEMIERFLQRREAF